ncbi:MAG: phosphoethanolamine--lipid A transferase [Hyphomicrobiaceae bacterium]
MSTRRTPEAVSFALALFFVAVLNIPFWRLFFRVVKPHTPYEWGFTAALFIALLAVTYMIVLLLAVRPLLRPVVGLLLPITAAASYFMLEYGTIIDVHMVHNVFETNSAEAGDLVTGKFIAYVAGLGVLPAALLWMVPIDWPTMRDDFWRKLKAAVVALPLAAVVIFPFFPALISTFRENIALRLTLTPSNYISALNKYAKSMIKHAAKEIEPIGLDAARVPPPQPGAKRQLFVIVVGETARADNFALNGYERATNPELSKIPDLINFPKVSSCGTDTAQSVPCMFSGLGRDNFSNSAAASQQNLLDVLARVGFDVVWRENQAGCKGVCNRVTTEVLTGLKHPTFYAYSENHDEILIDGLAERIKGLKKDTVIVMHMMGSHGPAYWKRYPERFETFKPVCRESQFSRCTREEIVNAYDNTIVYSDHVLAELIGVLRAQADSVDAGMIYMSDHGESLGENNMYLHGMPYALAPEAQTHVPMVVWMSQGLRARTSTDQGCLLSHSSRNLSHDNLFHSVLGILDVKTNIYDSSLDLFAPCRPGTVFGQRGDAVHGSLNSRF